MTYLYGGKILRVDLSSREVEIVPTERYANKFLGGRGFNVRMLYDAVDVSTDPLGPENIVGLAAGPLSGTLYPGCSRTDVMCKSPVTGYIGNASMGGDWSAELKHAGWDAVVLEGKSDKPVYVAIRNDRVEIRDASELWGKPNYEVQDLIRAELDSPDAKIVSIGPAGEKQVVYATIHCNVGNAAARTGTGAVMGSKNCKAIAVRGTQGIKVADPEAFLAACLDAHEAVRNSEYYEEVHTIGVMNAEAAYVRSGIEAGGDAHESEPSYEDKYYFRDFYRQWGHRRTGCAGCPVHCMENYRVPGIGGTVISCEVYPQLSAELRNEDMLLWYEQVRLCQQMGIDNTSMALTIQWLMELHELGMLDASLTDGVPIEFGSAQAIDHLMRATVTRAGFGDVVAGGMRATADYLDAQVPPERRNGKSTYYYAMQVNNNPMYGINPRMKSMALSYSIGRRSDCIQDLNMQEFDYLTAPVTPDWSDEHKKAEVEAVYAQSAAQTGIENAGDPELTLGNAKMVSDMGITTGVPDMVGTCKWHTPWLFMEIEPKDYARALTAGLGTTVTEEDLVSASLRLRNVERALECKLGRRRENDTVPEKEFGKPVSHGLWKGKIGIERDQLEDMKDTYYDLRGWDRTTGIPLKETLSEFGLDDIAEDLGSLGILPERRAGDTPADPREDDRREAGQTQRSMAN